MKLAVSNIAWSPEEEDGVLPKLKKLGVDGIEIALTKYWKDPLSATLAEIDACKKHLNDAGFDIPAAQALLFGHPELTIFETPEKRAQTFNYLVRICEICARLGVGALVFGSPKNRLRGELSLNDALSIAIEFFYNAAQRIASTGAILCIEANPPEYNCDFILTTKDGLDLVKSVNHPNFRLNIDTSTIIINGEDARTVISMSLPWTAHFHLSEPYLNTISPQNNIYKEFAQILQEINYSGWLSMEMKRELITSREQKLYTAVSFVRKEYILPNRLC